MDLSGELIGCRWRAFRVLSLTDNTDQNSPLHSNNPDFKLTLSAPSYCTPGIIFWLSTDMEDPNARCILLEIVQGQWASHAIIEFDWEGGRYMGHYVPVDMLKYNSHFRDILQRVEFSECCAIIFRLSSL